MSTIYHPEFQNGTFSSFRQEYVSEVMLDTFAVLTCDCGAKMPVSAWPCRCVECAAWWMSAEHVATAKPIIAQPSLERF